LAPEILVNYQPSKPDGLAALWEYPKLARRAACAWTAARQPQQNYSGADKIPGYNLFKIAAIYKVVALFVTPI
jgi:hypothetical protein